MLTSKKKKHICTYAFIRFSPSTLDPRLPASLPPSPRRVPLPKADHRPLRHPEYEQLIVLTARRDQKRVRAPLAAEERSKVRVAAAEEGPRLGREDSVGERRGRAEWSSFRRSGVRSDSN